jgi:superfamily II DNA or RNA helicase
MKQELFKHQQEFLELMPEKHLLCWEMGTAKTRTAIEWSKKHGQKPLIVIPKGLVKAWQRECKKWGLDSYTLVTKERFRADAHKIPKHNAVIIDEAHYFAGKSQMHKAMLSYIRQHDPKYIACLTGTPYMRHAWNVYRLGLILGAQKKYKTTWNYPTFDMTFFNHIRMGFRNVPVPKTDVATKQRLAQYVNAIGSTKKLSECVDVPESQEYPEYVEQTKEQRDAVASLDTVEPMVRYTKEQQIMGGFVKEDAYQDEQVYETNKLVRLTELVNQNNKIMVVCRYRHELRHIEEEMLKLKRTVFTLSGDTVDRDSVVQAARTSDECVLLVGAQLSEGWEIPEIETMVFYSHSFSLKDYVQMKGRIQRINNLKPRCYVHLLVEDSVDKEVYSSLMNKEDFLTHIYEKKRGATHSTTAQAPDAR